MSEIRVLSGLDPGQSSSRTVAVAMSGGVDSSLTAVLLREAGFDVVGLTMILWDYRRCGAARGERGCCDLSTADDARRVADTAGFPHYTLNLADEFEHAVVGDFIRAYLAGRTPNPCVRCNTIIKWRTLREKARALGCGLMATGHYARIAEHPDGSRSLMSGTDRSKDQSYFLWGLGPDDIAATLFPLGGMTKADVRKEALARNLPTAKRAESQEICFITDNDYGRFLAHRFRDESILPTPLLPGPILDMSGRVIGGHRGSAHFTIGQRRGLGIALGQPAYVIRIDAASNAIIIGGRNDLLSGGMTVGDLSWGRGVPPGPTFACTVRIRYRHPGVRAEVSLTPDGADIRFESPQSAVTPGQSAVFYDGSFVLGGGIIERTQ